ncbi:MAG TPA: protein kinase [Thermoanaerobaculia bacterium]|jgi:serine/threonine-protein kinase|nr:protein kinase [Thermoanaerobaculia bacterium]
MQPQLDRFEIVRILGKGGMGAVYLARDQRLSRYVAIKVLHTDDLGSPDRRARFLREARTAAAIRHQNVATIYEVDETADGQPFLVMEYCEGETLAQRMRRKALDAGEILNITRQIAAGLAAAHDNGVIHRDIKAANIMLEPSGQVKILDFGLARMQRELEGATSFESTEGHFFGTIHYLSPEQARGGAADERTDLFSVGIVMYQMASGHLPFNADSPLLIMEKIRDAEPEPFVPLDPAFPPPGTKIIAHLLQKDPKGRYQTAQELLSDLETIETPTVRMSPSDRTRSTLGRTLPHPRSALRIAVVLAALAALGTGIWFVRERSVAEPPPAPASTAQTPIRSLAVLPLANLANNSKDDFLSVSLADALVTKLQQIPSLQVRPTSAVVEYHGKKIDAKSASERLQVDAILEGHFLAAGDLVRVNLQLTDARSGFNIWTDSVDGKRDNLLELIDDVSSRTVDGLNQKLGVQQPRTNASQPRSSNPQAFEQYLRARSLNGSFDPADHEATVAALKRAIVLDPNFAAAYADLAVAISVGSARSLNTSGDTIEKAESYARQAVRLDPNLAQAHLALSRVFVRYPDRFRESVREVLASLRLNGSDTQALHSVATYFISSGDLQKAQCIIDQLVRIDPSSNEAETRGYYYVNAVDPEGALKNAEFALAHNDTALAGHDMRGVAFILQGNLDAADREADAAQRLVPRHYLGKSLKAMIAAARGDRPSAESYVRSFEADAQRNHWAALRAAYVYAKLGDRNNAMLWLHRSVTLGHHSWYALIKHPWLQPLQSDPEFQQTVTKIKADLDDVRDDVIGVYQLICR